MRLPDASCNAYLMPATIIAAGVDGLVRKVCVCARAVCVVRMRFCVCMFARASYVRACVRGREGEREREKERKREREKERERGRERERKREGGESLCALCIKQLHARVDKKNHLHTRSEEGEWNYPTHAHTHTHHTYT